jgi:nucleoside-diphosphate-sugar epimerase
MSINEDSKNIDQLISFKSDIIFHLAEYSIVKQGWKPIYKLDEYIREYIETHHNIA